MSDEFDLSKRHFHEVWVVVLYIFKSSTEIQVVHQGGQPELRITVKDAPSRVPPKCYGLRGGCVGERILVRARRAEREERGGGAGRMIGEIGEKEGFWEGEEGKGFEAG